MMQLKSNQMYLESQEQYALVCRLAQVRVERKALAVEEAQLETAIRTMMEPVTELVDVAFLNQQHELTEGELSEMFVARINAVGELEVHPAYVSNRFRPDSNTAEAPTTFEEEKTTFSSALPATKENEEEREGSLPPSPLSLEEKEEERERAAVVIKKEENATLKEEQAETGKATVKAAAAVKAAAKAKDMTTETAATVKAAAAVKAAAEDDINVKDFIVFFNHTMEEAHATIPKIEALRDKRLEALRARCRENGKAKVVEMIRRAARCPFLNGQGERHWRASIDWLLKPNNFTKVMEGVYDDFVMHSSKEQRAELRRINRELYEADMEEKRQAREEAAAQAATIEQLREIFGEDFGR